MNKKDEICITGLMLRNVGQDVIVELEIDGRWVEVLCVLGGPMEVSFSHIIETSHIAKKANLQHFKREN